MERRGYAEGSISERKNKNGTVTGYQAQLRLPEGRRSQTCETEREARKWLREARIDAARGTLAAKRPLTLATYLAEWLEGTQGKVKTRTYIAYRLNVQRVPDWLGALRLDELRPRHFQRFYNELTAAGKAPRTVRQVHMVLHKSLGDALQLEAVVRNPTEGVRLPRIPRTEPAWYSNEQLGALFTATEEDRFHALWLVLGTLGLRMGEALALHWSDIDWKRNTLTVRHTLYRDQLTGTLTLQDETKTKGSRRTLTLPTETAAALRAHRDRQDFERKKVRDVWQDHNLVFCTGLGTPLDVQRIHHHWTKACEAAGIPRNRPHDLRHSVASNLIAGGMGLLEVAHLLGHSNASMVTTVYGHVASDDHRRAAALMDSLLERPRAGVS